MFLHTFLFIHILPQYFNNRYKICIRVTSQNLKSTYFVMKKLKQSLQSNKIVDVVF